MLLCSYVDPQPGCVLQPVACRCVAQQARDRQPPVSVCVTRHSGIGRGNGFKLRSAIAGRPAVGAGLGTMLAAVGRYICTCTPGGLMGDGAALFSGSAKRLGPWGSAERLVSKGEVYV